MDPYFYSLTFLLHINDPYARAWDVAKRILLIAEIAREENQ